MNTTICIKSPFDYGPRGDRSALRSHRPEAASLREDESIVFIKKSLSFWRQALFVRYDGLLHCLEPDADVGAAIAQVHALDDDGSAADVAVEDQAEG